MTPVWFAAGISVGLLIVALIADWIERQSGKKEAGEGEIVPLVRLPARVDDVLTVAAIYHPEAAIRAAAVARKLTREVPNWHLLATAYWGEDGISIDVQEEDAGIGILLFFEDIDGRPGDRMFVVGAGVARAQPLDPDAVVRELLEIEERGVVA